MSALSPKDRRALAIGVSSIAVVIGIAQGIPRWREWESDRRATAGAVLARASEFDRALRVLPSIADSGRRSAAQYDSLAASLIEGETPTAASARLAELVSTAADEAAATITSLQIRPDTVFRDRFARVGVRISAVGDVVTLVELLESLENHETLLSVRELSISQSEPAASESRAEALRFQLLIEALAVRPRSTLVQASSK